MLNALFAEVEKQATSRNQEVVDSVALYLVKPSMDDPPEFTKKTCNYMKALNQLTALGTYKGHWSDDDWDWHRRRTLRQKLKFKTPCACCQACYESGYR
jgi:hypothetical protein